MRVVHLTSVHARGDTRIRKECRDLAAAGHTVSLIVADGLGDADDGEVDIVDVGRAANRFVRMVRSTIRVGRRGRRLNADVYHFHDPELLPVGVALARTGASVVYDCHEDVSRQVLTKPYLGRTVARLVSQGVNLVERWAVARIAAVVAATPSIARGFDGVAPVVVEVNNFPIIDELAPRDDSEIERKALVFVGKLSEIRGIAEVIEALPLTTTPIGLTLVGDFADPEFAERCRALDGFDRVTEMGVLDRPAVRRVLQGAVAGLVTFHPSPNHVDAQPNKLFEYMAAGVPVIASDFPYWRSLVGEAGVFVDPQDPRSIAAAIDEIVGDPERAAVMGRAGAHAVADRFDWASASAALCAMYDTLGAD